MSYNYSYLILHLSIFYISLFALYFSEVTCQSQTKEKFLKNLRRLTYNGTNAEAYWSFDGSKIIFQAVRDGTKCDQIFSMNSDGEDIRLISNGKGRTTCSFFLPGNQEFIYSSTMDSYGRGCPPTPDQRYGYVWPIYKTMAIYKASWPSGEIIQQLTNSNYYDAEATINPQGNRIIFTSARDGDLELYTMTLNGSEVKRMTFSPGYDGGAFFSNDGKQIVWRANRPKGQDLREYLDLLSLGLVQPVGLPMEIFVMDSDNANQRQLTNIGGASFAPYFLPPDDGIIFSSDIGLGFPFNLFAVNMKGNKVIQVTTEGSFNSFPMFSRDGKYLMFASDRDAVNRWDIDIYVAEWNPINFDLEEGISIVKPPNQNTENKFEITALTTVLLTLGILSLIGGVMLIFTAFLAYLILIHRLKMVPSKTISNEGDDVRTAILPLEEAHNILETQE